MLHLGDKPAVKSVTIISAAVIAAIQAAEGCGVVPPGTMHYLAVAAQSLAVLSFGYGVRRAISGNGLGAALSMLDEIADEEELPEVKKIDPCGDPLPVCTRENFDRCWDSETEQHCECCKIEPSEGP